MKATRHHHITKGSKIKLGVLALLLLIVSGAIVSFNISALRASDKPLVNEKGIGTDDVLLKRYIKAYGVDATVAFIKILPVDCHQRVHKVGRLNYELKGKNAFDVLNSECMSGYTHGVIESFFHEHGTSNLAKNLELICQGRQNGFYDHQCFHGVGHGLMAYNDYDLPAALKGCDSLPPHGSNKESCYSGVFMENVVGAIATDEAKASANAGQFHSSAWLSDDLLFPCNAVENVYKNACFMFQSSRMIQIVGPEYHKVADACVRAESPYRQACFLSMGRDLSNTSNTDYATIEKTCNYVAGDLRQSCIGGAAQDKFWHESEQDEALGLCKAVQSADSKQNCYTIIAERGQQIISTSTKMKEFCSKFEHGYASLCGIKT